jgi:hypothetical protein
LADKVSALFVGCFDNGETSGTNLLTLFNALILEKVRNLFKDSLAFNLAAPG